LLEQSGVHLRIAIEPCAEVPVSSVGTHHLFPSPAFHAGLCTICASGFSRYSTTGADISGGPKTRAPERLPARRIANSSA
jgi:hypothetical protein